MSTLYKSISKERILQLQERMTDKELYQLTHPEEWPHENQLPVTRRGGKPVWNRKDCGIVLDDNPCCVWTDVHLGEGDPREGTPAYYESPKHLLSEWKVD